MNLLSCLLCIHVFYLVPLHIDMLSCEATWLIESIWYLGYYIKKELGIIPFGFTFFLFISISNWKEQEFWFEIFLQGYEQKWSKLPWWTFLIDETFSVFCPDQATSCSEWISYFRESLKRCVRVATGLVCTEISVLNRWWMNHNS
jgi:hypothetical protein